MDVQPIRASTRAPGKRALTRAQNRTVILDSARRIFAERGYAATTVRDIIRATPLASGTFYNYFTSKEEIFQAIRDESALELRPRLRAVRATATTLEEFVTASFRTYFAFVVEERAQFEQAPSNETLRVRVDTPEILAGFHELRDDILDAIARRVLPPVDVDFLMAAMIGIAFEVSEQMIKRDPPDADAAARFAAGLVLGGIGALAKRSSASRKAA
jgi:AcrR family transcriptional regulator